MTVQEVIERDNTLQANFGTDLFYYLYEARNLLEDETMMSRDTFSSLEAMVLETEQHLAKQVSYDPDKGGYASISVDMMSDLVSKSDQLYDLVMKIEVDIVNRDMIKQLYLEGELTPKGVEIGLEDQLLKHEIQETLSEWREEREAKLDKTIERDT